MEGQYLLILQSGQVKVNGILVQVKLDDRSNQYSHLHQAIYALYKNWNHKVFMILQHVSLQ